MKAKMRWLFLFAVFAIGAVVFSACAKTSDKTSAPTVTPAPTVVVSAREPKRLEMKVTLEMRDFYFANEQGQKVNTVRVLAGKTVGIHIVNKGAVEHEIIFGREVKQEEGRSDGYQKSLFKDVPVDAFVYPFGNKVEVATEGMIEEIELEPGADVWLRVKFPAEAKGVWEIGCFVPGHYEGGMKAVFIVD